MAKDATSPAGEPTVDNTAPAVGISEHYQPKDSSHVEQVLSQTDDLKREDMDYSRVDKEVQEYASRDRVEVDEETDKRLKKMIDRRVLAIMICTYFLQALDKGTMSFASIMGIIEDTGLKGQEVCRRLPSRCDRKSPRD